MQKIISPLLLAGLLMSLFSACDPGVQYMQIIENQSDYTLQILPRDSVMRWGNLMESDSFIVSENTEAKIVDHMSIGHVNEFEACPLYSDSLLVKIEGNDSLKLVLDLHDPTNWTYQVIDETALGGGSCECRLVVREADIQ